MFKFFNWRANEELRLVRLELELVRQESTLSEDKFQYVRDRLQDQDRKFTDMQTHINNMNQHITTLYSLQQGTDLPQGSVDRFLEDMEGPDPLEQSEETYFNMDDFSLEESLGMMEAPEEDQPETREEKADVVGSA